MSQIADSNYLESQLQELEAECAYMADYVANRKPYWLGFRHPRDGEMRWDLWNYAPLAHYDRVIEQTRERLEAEPRTDGGSSNLHQGTTRATVYYWLDPDTGAALYHTGVNEEKMIPFFPNEEAAQDYLERRAEADGDEPFENLSLYKARTRKVGDAVDVLTDQSGIEDFVPDGGVSAPRQQYTDYLQSLAESSDLHTALTYQAWLEAELAEIWEEYGSPYLHSDGGMQIDNPAPGRVWFWYNPSLDTIVQEEVEPYDIRGVFESEDDAKRFLDWYAEQYDVDDTSHLELYSAEIQLEGFGRKYLDGDSERSEEPPGQADLDVYRSTQEDNER